MVYIIFFLLLYWVLYKITKKYGIKWSWTEINKIMRNIPVKLITIVEHYLKNLWKIFLKRAFFSTIIIYIMKIDIKNAFDFIMGSSELENTLYSGLWKLGIMLTIYLAWRRFGIHNFKLDYYKKQDIQSSRRKYILDQLESWGLYNRNLNNIDDYKKLQEDIRNSQELSEQFKPRYFLLENAKSKNSFVNYNEVDFYILKDTELKTLKSLIEYREGLWWKELLASGMIYNVAWFLVKIIIKLNSEDNGIDTSNNSSNNIGGSTRDYDTPD